MNFFATTILSIAFAGFVFQSAVVAEVKKVPFKKAKQVSKRLQVDANSVRQPRPTPLGVSGGSTAASAQEHCYSGTLGALVQDANGTQYILSNAHVFAGERGTPINQPGYADVNCQYYPDDTVANLESWIPLVAGAASSVDAAMAKVLPGKVTSIGSIFHIGTISSTPRAAFIQQQVKKCGNSSGVTQGQVIALNATISVLYENTGQESPFFTTFTNQILVSPGTFLQPGDAGSLLLENVAMKPRPIGLLFAGGSSIGVANPIETVLSALNVTLVGVPTKVQPSFSPSENLMEFAIGAATNVKELYGSMLMQIDGVVGHAVGFSQDAFHTPVIIVLVTKLDEVLLSQIPQELSGIPVEVMEVGVVKAY